MALRIAPFILFEKNDRIVRSGSGLSLIFSHLIVSYDIIRLRIQDTLVFNVDVEDHPFYLKSAAGEGTENALPDIDNNGSSTGNIQWIPNEAREFYFQCAHHWNMGGKIVVNPN